MLDELVTKIITFTYTSTNTPVKKVKLTSNE